MAYHGPPLSRGAMRALVGGAQDLRPVLQVIADIKQIGTAGQAAGAAPERFRLVMSDGEHFQHAMLATQLNDLVKRGDVNKLTVVRIEECVPASAARPAARARGGARAVRTLGTLNLSAHAHACAFPPVATR
jgi:hypothetical protein